MDTNIYEQNINSFFNKFSICYNVEPNSFWYNYGNIIENEL